MQDLVANHKARQCVTWPQPLQTTLLYVSKHNVCLLIFSTPTFSLQYFFHNRNAVDVGTVIREAYRLQESTPAEVNPKRMLEPFTPLTKGQYPIFNKYPKFIVDYQVSCRPSLSNCTLSSNESCWKWTFNLTTRAFLVSKCFVGKCYFGLHCYFCRQVQERERIRQEELEYLRQRYSMSYVETNFGYANTVLGLLKNLGFF